MFKGYLVYGFEFNNLKYLIKCIKKYYKFNKYLYEKIVKLSKEYQKIEKKQKREKKRKEKLNKKLSVYERRKSYENYTGGDSVIKQEIIQILENLLNLVIIHLYFCCSHYEPLYFVGWRCDKWDSISKPISISKKIKILTQDEQNYIDESLQKYFKCSGSYRIIYNYCEDCKLRD